MTFKIRNVSGGSVDIDDLGLTLEVASEYDLRQDQTNQVFISEDLRNLINSGDIVILDPLGGSPHIPLSTADALKALDVTSVPNYRIFGGELDQLDDVVIGSPITGNVLKYNGTNWEDGFLSFSDLAGSPTDTGITELTGDVTAGPGSGSQIATIANNAITDPKLRDSSGLSVIGRSSNTTGDPADIIASTDGQVLRRSGNTLGFGTVGTTGITNDAVNNTKLTNMAQGTIKGRASGSGTGDPVDLTPAQVRTIINVEDNAAADQNLFETVASDSGSTTANTTTDTLTITGGTGISTSITGDTLTITNDSPNVEQDAFAIFSADTGSVTATTATSSLVIAGGTGISTSIAGSPQTLTIINDNPNVDQNVFETVVGDTGSATASTTTDTLTIAGGTNVSTTVAGNTLTIDSTVDVGFGVYAFARTLGDGTPVTSNGLTVIRVSTGVYDYTFTQAFGSADYVVIGNPILTTTDTNFQISNITSTGFRATLGEGDNSTTPDTPVDTEHSVAVFGVDGPTGSGSAYQSWLNVGNVGTEQDFLDSLQGIGDPDQNLFQTVAADTGSTTANTTTDTLTVAGGTGISTSIAGSPQILTITNDSPNVDQNLFETITADTGSTTANTTTDTLTIAGGTGISTSITGDTLTIVNDSPNVDQNIFQTVVVPSGGPIVADSATDTLTFTQSAGIAISGNASTDTITIAPGDDLAAVEALSSTGFAARTGTNTWALRSLTQPAAGLTITNPAGTAGNPTFALANDLLGLENLSSTGIAVRTGTSTWATRTLVAGTGISLTNANGVSGNITITNSSPNVNQNLFATFTADSGTTTANTTTDTLTVAGGTGISTSISGDTLTIVNDSPNVDQNVFTTFNADSGTTTANTTTDTLTLAGGTGIDTSISGDTVTHTLNAGLEDLNNVLGSPAAVDGNVLTFNGTAGEWQAQAPATFVSLEAFDAYFTTGVVNINAGWTDVPLDVQRQITSAFTHTTPDAAVAINTTDKYLVIGRVTTENVGGGGRSESTARLVLDTGTGFVEVPGTLGWNYNRNSNQGTSTATIQAILDLAAGDEIKLQAQRADGNDDIELDPNGCALTIISVKGLKGDPGPPGPSGAPGVALVQARRSLSAALPTTWTDVGFDVTDAESDSTVIEHNAPTTDDRITVKEDGWYQVYYHLTVDDEVEGRVRINDTTVVPGSEQEAGEINDTNDIIAVCSALCFVELNANDFLTVQVQSRTTAETLFDDALFSVHKVDGVEGPQGPAGAPGAGQSVEIQNNDTTVVDPVQVLNFEGDLTVVDEGSGKVTVNVNAPDTLPKFIFPADTFDNPFASDWAVSNLAPAAVDTNNNAIVVRRFDDTIEEGVGFTIPIPTNATEFTLKIKSRAETGPVSAQTVVPKLYYRTITDNGAITSWSSTVLTAVNIPTNEFYQYDEQTLSLTGIASPDNMVQFEFTRDTTSASDTLVGDWDLLSLEIEFG